MSILDELTERDFEDILYDIKESSIFFESPVKVRLPARGWERTIGNGFGGFSWTLFNRGADCTVCGNCCKRTFRRIWFWWGTENNRPAFLEPVEIEINGFILPIWVHLNEMGEERCDFLQDDTWNGVDVAFCSLHSTETGNIKPVHCHLHPLTGVYKVRTKRGPRGLLSRRLPHRNFRWPKCPIDVERVPYFYKDFIDDEFALRRITTALGNVPGSWSYYAYQLWRNLAIDALAGNPTDENIFFEDTFKPDKYFPDIPGLTAPKFIQR